jgi:GR25 family glycosyltransferase involved in LPS biosynthesis
MRLPLEVLVINLVRRKDRLVRFKSHFPFSFRVIDAFDGKNLSESVSLDALTEDQCNLLDALKSWEYNPEAQVPGIFGCWQSHLSIWNYLVHSSSQVQNVLVLEDDASPSAKCHSLLPLVLESLPLRFDFAFLGGQPSPDFTRHNYDYSEIINSNHPHTDQLFSWGRMNSNFLNATNAYLISRMGAKSILQILDVHLKEGKSVAAVDDFIRQNSGTLLCYELQPHLFYSPWNSTESDIR